MQYPGGIKVQFHALRFWMAGEQTTAAVIELGGEARAS
jgi:hypothetical protein